MQLKYSVKKELMEFFCTKRWMAFFLPALFFILSDPLMTLVLPKIMEATFGQLGMDAGGMMTAMPATQEFAMQSFCSDFFQMGVLALLLSMMKTAGGDQKNKSCVIPICSGMKRDVYLLAKFIVYPVVAFLGGAVSFLLTFGFSAVLFEERIPFWDIWPALLAFGLYLAFVAALMLTIGCMTGKGGISAIIVFIISTFATTILSMLQINRYNPLALFTFSTGFTGVDYLEYGLTVLITLASFALLYFLTTVVFRQRRLV